MKKQTERRLEKIFLDPKNPASFSSVKRLYEAVRQYDGDVKMGDVKEWLSGQEAYTIFRRNPQRFPRLKILVKGPHRILSADLADMQRIAEHNDGYRYVLICVDAFTRYMYAFKLRSKAGTDVMPELEKVLKLRPFTRIHVDEGREFYNKHVQEMLDRYACKLYSTRSNTKAAHSERAIRTWKGRMFRYMHHANTWRWIDKLSDVVDAYNKTKHSTFKLKFSPEDVDRRRVPSSRIHRMMYQTVPEHRKRYLEARYKVGDHVRLSQSRHKHARGFYPANTEEIFTVRRVNLKSRPVTYFIEDYDGEVVEGVFYYDDLIKSKLKESYPFDILKERGKGKRGKEYFIHFRGWPDKYNRWVSRKYVTQHQYN